MLKLISIIAILTILPTTGKTQDSLFRSVANRAAVIAECTVLEVGPKISHEAGILEYTIICKVNTVFKGAILKGDTISIDITEYTLKLGGRGDTLPFPPGDNLIEVGVTMVFFINPNKYEKQNQKTIYLPVDSILGVLTPSPQLEFYLRFLYKQN